MRQTSAASKATALPASNPCQHTFKQTHTPKADGAVLCSYFAMSLKVLNTLATVRGAGWNMVRCADLIGGTAGHSKAHISAKAGYIEVTDNLPTATCQLQASDMPVGSSTSSKHWITAHASGQAQHVHCGRPSSYGCSCGFWVHTKLHRHAETPQPTDLHAAATLPRSPLSS
jgi:hypothetical protein